ncbi:hypothetical protein GF380_05620, partial [Candidatus Uhrbacteria bacterium]|nr:hypothetical protein [Candidatus Uhrbacteria bacterium]MBD3284484.1 hypothetical protein [Candidatus Uhrbacteria bacterium]
MIFTRLLILTTAIFLIGGGLMTALPVHAQDAEPSPITEGLDAVGETVKLPDNDPRIIAGRIINVVLGLLGIILLVIVVYGGFLYMTSGGDAGKVQTAIAYIRNGIIGLIIILLSWAIARYIINALIEATTGGQGVSTTGPPGGGGFTPGGSSSVFQVKGITPNGETENRKITVKIVVSMDVNEASLSQPDVVTVTAADGTRLDGTLTLNRPREIWFTPSTPCPPPNSDYSCVAENTEYTVRVSAALESLEGDTLTCGGFAPDCEAEFRSGTIVDLEDPNVSVTFPLNNFPVSADALVDVRARATDNTGIAYISFFDDGDFIDNSVPETGAPTLFHGLIQWDTLGLAPGETRSLSATAYDTDTGSGDSPSVNVIIRPAHCFDGVQNEGETGLDCGGDPSDPDNYCGACPGDQCTVGTDCASGICENGVCVAQPIITSVDPDNGATGSFVTIRGYNFGTNGQVFFLGAGGEPVEAYQPQACLDKGVSTWSQTQVVVQVPETADSGPIRLVNLNSNLSDDTNIQPDPDLPDFLVNDIRRAGICALVPSNGAPADAFKLLGAGFGNTSAGINFGNDIIQGISWSDDEIEAYIPNVQVGSYPVSVTVDGSESNALTMNVHPVSGGGVPEILEITPSQGPVSQYVTIRGLNFGHLAGQVFFGNRITEEVALADVSFPEACANGYWTDKNIVVKVPRVFTEGGSGDVLPGPYAVWVRTTRPTAPESNRVNFAVNTDPLTPGVCAVVPRVGPVGTSVTAHGEGFTTGPGAVRFYNNKLGSDTRNWTQRSIETRIPSGALTGPMTVEPSSLDVVSNPYLIEVRNCNESVGICSEAEECCQDGSCREFGTCPEGAGQAMFAWQFSTGLIPQAPRVIEQCDDGLLPSPAPWSAREGGRDVCLNDVIGMLFSPSVDPTTIGADTIRVHRCTGSGGDPCGERDADPIDASYQVLSSYVTVRPTELLEPDTWYAVDVTTGVRGDGPTGIFMEQNSGCDDGIGYCFNFRTKNDTNLCQIGSVLVNPDPYLATIYLEAIDYEAVPRPVGDVCRILNCEPYDWVWDTNPARADITNDRFNGRGSCFQQATAKIETNVGEPVQVSALEVDQSVQGAGDLTIAFTKPRVSDFGPACDTACVNAAIWAEFNIEMDTSNVEDNIVVKRCLNQACLDYAVPENLDLSNANITFGTVPGVANDERNRFLKIEPVDGSGNVLLEPGRFYQVILRAGTIEGFRSKDGAALSELNHPDGFSWKFRVKTGEDAFCEPNRIEVTPTEKYETIVGARQVFTAHPYTEPDACSEQGQLLVASGGFSWESRDVLVATLLDGQVDTGSSLPPGCTERCTLQGAQGRYGQTAQCGNGVIETTNGRYCDGSISRTVRGNFPCLLLAPNASGGEECDGQPNCNSLCLWDPVDTVNDNPPGSCGDGVIQVGEDCDFGRICMGAPATSTSPDGWDCTSPAAAVECLANGGTCSTRQTRGCSLNCRNLGSLAGNVTCGNADVSDGEDCDDGNVASGDGCSSNCLHEGSKPVAQVVALCGNGNVEPGEECEASAAGGALPDHCDPQTCLWTGRTPCLFQDDASAPLGCCGNGGAPEAGEQCEDGNSVSGDGCSATCLLEGSDPLYLDGNGNPEPSFCGDENWDQKSEAQQCEATPPPIRDQQVDGAQLALIVGEADLPPGEERMSTEIVAAYANVEGTA